MPRIFTIILLFCSTNFLLQCQNKHYELTRFLDWSISSIPMHQNNIFPESEFNNNLEIGFNRARICWYYIDPIYYCNLAPLYIRQDTIQLQNHYVRRIYLKELFPDAYVEYNQSLSTFDIAFYPLERGPYNYSVDKTTFSEGIDSTGKLKKPETRWAGIMSNIPDGMLNGFNIKYLAGWFMDPFIYNNDSLPVEILIQIGYVSEDVLKDGVASCEHTLLGTGNTETSWGYASNIITTHNFSDYHFNMDYGLDGLNDGSERTFFNSYTSHVGYIVGQNEYYMSVVNDPSGDNYIYHYDNFYSETKTSILGRYKNYNNAQENSFSSDNPNLIRYTLRPDVEDLNNNLTFDTTENYFQYRLYLHPDSLDVGINYITDKKTVIFNDTEEIWYKFRIPLDTTARELYGNLINIYDSEAIRLILRNCKDSIILRFDELAFTENDLPVPLKEYYTGVYPNPFIDNITISSQRGVFDVYLYDIQGRFLETVYYNDKVVRYDFGIFYGSENYVYEVTKDLSHLEKGIYFLEIISGYSRTIEKIVKL